MSQFFDKLTASASNLGMTGKQSLAGLAAAAQIARRGTGDAAQAATNLDNFLGKLNAQVTYKAFEKMDVDLGKLKEEAKASGDYLGYMADAIKKLTGGDAAKISALFSDVQAGAFVQKMVQDLDDYKKIQADALTASGVAAEDFATVMQSSSAQVDKMKINMEASANEGGALDGIIKSLTALSSWADEHPELAKWIIFGTAGLAVGGAVALGISATVTAIGGIMTALSGLSVFLAANPIVLTILGLAAAGAAGYVAGTYINDWIDSQVQAITGDKAATLGSALYDLIEGEGGIIPTIKNSWESIKQAGGNLMQGLRTGITEGLKGALGIGEKLKDAIAYTRNTVKDWLQVGKDIIDGLWQGIQSTMRKPLEAIGDLAKKLPEWAKDLLGIKSPSRVFVQIGAQVGEGFAVGIESTSGRVNDAFGKLAFTAYDPATAAWLQQTLQDQIDLLEDQGTEFAAVGSQAEATASKIKATYRDTKGRYLPDDEVERAAAVWQRSSDDMQRMLSDALMRGFEGGKDAGKNFVDTIKNYLKTAFLKPIAVQISATLAGAVGLGGSGSASASGGGGSDSLSTLSSLNSAYKALANGFTSLGSTAGSYAIMASQGGSMGSTVMAGSQQAAMLNAQGMGSYSVSSLGGAVGSAASLLGGAAVGFVVGKMISGGYSAIGKSGNTAVAAGTAIGAIWGPLGAAIGGAVGGLVNRTFGRKLAETGIAGSFGGGQFFGANYEYYKGGTFRSDKTKVSDLDPQVDSLLENSFATLQTKTALMAKVLGQSATAIYGFTHSIQLDFRGLTDKEIEDKIGAVFDDMGNSMASLIPGLDAVTKFGESSSAALTRLYDSIFAVNGVIDTLNLQLFDVSLSGAAMASSLADAFGGMDKLQAATAAYYSAFYTEEQRIAESTQQLTQAMSNLGYTLPASKEGFRDVVAGLNLTTVAGQQTFAALMGLAPMFAEVSNSWEAAAKEAAVIAKEAADKEAADKKIIRDEELGLESQLLQLQGNIVELRRRELQAIDPANQALQESIWLLEDLTEATDKKNEADKVAADLHRADQAAFQDIMYGSAQKLALLTRTTADQFNALGIAAPKTRGEYIALVESMNTSTEAASATKDALVAMAPAIHEIANAQEAAIEQRASWADRLAIVNNPALAREIELKNELKGVTDWLTASYIKQVYAAEDLRTATDKYTEALKAAQSAQSAVDAIRDQATDNYLSAVEAQIAADDRIKQLDLDARIEVAQEAQKAADNMKDLAKSLRAFIDESRSPDVIFGEVLRKALGGDSEAMQALPEAARGAIDLAKSAATSSSEFRLAEARVFAQMRSVAAVADSLSVSTVAMPPALTEREEADKALTAATSKVTAEGAIADSVGANKFKAADELETRYKAALIEKAKADADLLAVTRALNKIRDNTATTYANVASLKDKFSIDLEVSAKSEIEKTISVITGTFSLSPEQKKLALLTTGTIKRTIQAVADASWDPETKNLAFGGTTNLSRTLSAVVNESSNWTDVTKQLAFGATTDLSRTLEFTASTVGISETLRAQAFGLTGLLSRTVEWVAQNDALSEVARAQAFGDATDLARKVKMALDLPSQLAIEQVFYDLRSPITKLVKLSIQSQVEALAAGTEVTPAIQQAINEVADAEASGVSRYVTEAGAAINAATSGTGATAVWVEGSTGADVVIQGAKGGRMTGLELHQWIAGEEKAKTPWSAIFAALKENGLTMSWMDTMYSFQPGTWKEFAAIYGVKEFAKGGAFTNSIVDQATPFSIMGEAGPEAIMPLTRMSNGNLGVEAQMPDWSTYGREDNNNAALVAELRQLRGEVKALNQEVVLLRRDNNTANAAIATESKSSARVLRKWDTVGIPLEATV
jgi:hypothetical protein